MITVHTLGAATIDVGSLRITPTAAKKFGLLLVLAGDPGRRIPRSVLRSLLFPGSKDVNARHSLRELVYELRHSGVEFDNDSYGIAVKPGAIRADWRRVLDGPLDDTALESIEGGFLPGYIADLSEDFSEWYDAFRAKVIFELTKELLSIVEQGKRGGSWSKAERAARACLALDPFNERATVAVAEMLAIRGSADQALRLLDECHIAQKPNAEILSNSIRRLRRQIFEKAAQEYGPTEQLAFCGRDSEMGLASDALTAVRHGAIRAVLFTGAAGVGKTRILAEFAKRLGLENVSLVRASAHPRDEVMPLGTIAAMVRTLLGQPGALGCSPSSMKWLKRLVDPQRPSEDPLPSDDTSFAIARAIVDLTSAVSSEAPLVLILDDAQWADGASLGLLNTIALSRQSTKILILFAARDGQRLFDAGDWHQLLVARDVSPLGKTSALELLAHELERTSTDEALFDWMFETSGGNPFFLDCLVAHYRSTGERFSIPRKLNSLIDQSIAALTTDARDVLEAIIALGRRATPPRIEQLLDISGGLLIRIVRELEARRLIGAVQGIISPSHSLISESVQRNCTPIARQFLYRRMATLLEGELPSSGDSRELWECAEAWIVAAEPERAAHIITTCAERCLAIGRAREASRLFLRAANLVQGEQRRQLAEQSVRSASAANESSLILEGLELLDRDGIPRRHDDIEMASLMAKSLHDENPNDTLVALAACMSCVSASLQHRLSAAYLLLAFCDQNHDINTVMRIREQLFELVAVATTDHRPVQLQCALIFHASYGDLDLVPGIAEELLSIAQNSRQDVRADLMRKAASAFYRCGDVERSIRILEDCYCIARDFGLARVADGIAIGLVGQYSSVGSTADANRWYDVANTVDPAHRDYYMRRAYSSNAAEIEFVRGNVVKLRELAAENIHADANEGSARTWRLETAWRYAIAFLSGDLLQPDLVVGELTKHHVAGFEIGDIADFEVAVASRVLNRYESADDAAKLIDHYLRRVRRRGTPLTAPLTQAMRLIGR
jgi:DNA-binding SARP family transcriptional activator